MAIQRPSLCVLLVGGLLIGCSRSPEQPPGTGAKECVQGYFEALIRQDWSRAYASLDPASQKRSTSQQFNRLAQTYHSNLGFEPDAVHVGACEERGAEATAHVVLTGRAGTKSHRYKDAVTLRRDDDGWHVVLPPNFGQGRKR
jgi:hypothetical protein